MASTTWKGHLTFGLVSIPLKLYPAARSQTIEFHQIHKPCRTRLRRPLFCPTCNRLVERTEVVKGYEYEKGQYLLIEEQEIKKLAPETGGTMEIGEFVTLAEIDPLYFDTSYLAVPEKSGAKAYRLLVETMEQTGKAALAKVAMHQREYLVAIRAREHGLTLHTMYFNNEIRSVSEYGHIDADVKQAEIKLATELVENLSTHFKPERYHDEYQTKLRALLDAKLKGKKVPIATEHEMAPVIDMMEALKKSLAKHGPATSKASRSAAGESHGTRARRKAS
jgi:DNA end-binding protein Ku